MTAFKSLDEITEIAEDASLITAAYNLALEHATQHCKKRASEWYGRNTRWQHHQGAAIGADKLADEILFLKK